MAGLMISGAVVGWSDPDDISNLKKKIVHWFCTQFTESAFVGQTILRELKLYFHPVAS